MKQFKKIRLAVKIMGVTFYSDWQKITNLTEMKIAFLKNQIGLFKMAMPLKIWIEKK